MTHCKLVPTNQKKRWHQLGATSSSMDDTIQGIIAHGSGEQLAKLDIESTYRLVPVDPDERPLLGMWLRERLYICTALSFGLSSEPITLITGAGVASALQYITEWKGRQRYCNYLDDFLMFRSLNSGKISTSPRLKCEARIPITIHKMERRSTVIKFLGI